MIRIGRDCRDGSKDVMVEDELFIKMDAVGCLEFDITNDMSCVRNFDTFNKLLIENPNDWMEFH